jgi:hypothetical protein
MQAAAITSRFLTGCSSKAGFADSESVVSNDGLLHHIVASHLLQTVSSQALFLKLTSSILFGWSEIVSQGDLCDISPYYPPKLLDEDNSIGEGEVDERADGDRD